MTKIGTGPVTSDVPERGTRMPANSACRPGPSSRRALPGALAALATGALLIAVCTPASASVRPKLAARSSSTTARSRIIANWDAFFESSAPTSHKVALLQNGERYAKIVAAQASSPLTKGVGAEVSVVTLTSNFEATVIYSLTIGGKPVLTDLKGEAVLQSGRWKVGDQSFCALLSLEQVKTPGCPASPD